MANKSRFNALRLIPIAGMVLVAFAVVEVFKAAVTAVVVQPPSTYRTQWHVPVIPEFRVYQDTGHKPLPLGLEPVVYGR